VVRPEGEGWDTSRRVENMTPTGTHRYGANVLQSGRETLAQNLGGVKVDFPFHPRALRYLLVPRHPRRWGRDLVEPPDVPGENLVRLLGQSYDLSSSVLRRTQLRQVNNRL
jgi:hypothetical protein